MTKKEFSLSRSGEDYVAVITCEVEDADKMTPNAIMEHLCAAVTAWVDTTPEGRECFADTEEDMNVGDLAMNGIPPGVFIYLAEYGIHHLTIKIFGGEETCRYNYDSHLYCGNRPWEKKSE